MAEKSNLTSVSRSKPSVSGDSDVQSSQREVQSSSLRLNTQGVVN